MATRMRHVCNGLYSWCLSPYAIDIHNYLKRKELRAPKMRFRAPQMKYRQGLIDWIRSISEKLKLSNTTVHIGVRLIDLFMDRHDITDHRLASVCLTCLLVAAKFEEEDSKIPKFKELTAIVHDESSVADFANFELVIMKAFNWSVSYVTAAHFAEYYSLFSIIYGDSDHFGTPHRHLQDLVQSSLRDFLDTSLTEVYMNEFTSSKVAASCLLAARLEHGIIPVWPKTLADITGYSLTSLQPCLDVLMEAHTYRHGSKSKEEPRFDSGYESSSPDNVFKKRILLKR